MSCSDPLTEFAEDLRRLRRRAAMTYADMSAVANYAASTLSQAATGHRLPSLDVVLAYVRCCGGDVHAWQLRWDALRRSLAGVDDDAPAPEPPGRSSGPWWHTQTSVPDEPTSFVGRERELGEVKDLLTRARIVTVIGTGGVGKTRLAYWLARRHAGDYADGVCLVELADLTDPAVLPERVATALGIADDPARTTAAALAMELAGRRMLLVLDNCEHLHAASAHLVRTLVRAAPRLTLLATSRQALGVLGEHLLHVAPLELPPPGAAPSETTVDRYPVLRLFQDRAAAVRGGFAVTTANRAAVVELCRRLDGLPLAVELTTRWLRTLTVGQLLEHLDTTFTLPATSGPPGNTRHRTIHSVLSWSQSLCTEAENRAWERISLVPGTMSLDLVAALAGGSGVPEPLAAVSGIVDKSLLFTSVHDDVMRYQMPETIRGQGSGRLSEQQKTAVRRKHLAWCREQAEAAAEQWYGPGQMSALHGISTEHHHFRTALSTSCPGGAADRLRIAGALWLYWSACGHVSEGRRRLEQEPAEDRGPAADRLPALWAVSFLALIQGDLTSAGRYADAAEEQAEMLHTPTFRGRAKMVRGLIRLFSEESNEAIHESSEALAVCRSVDDGMGIAMSQAQMGLAHLHLGHDDEAQEHLSRAMDMGRVAGERWHHSYVLWCLGLLHLERGAPETAVALLLECIEAKRVLKDRVGAAAVVETLAWAAHALGGHETAARLIGAAEAVRPIGAIGLFGMQRLIRDRARHSEAIRAALGTDRFTAAHEEGARLTPASAITYALAPDGCF
ncbi:AAA family ATPase [Streptomyces sp. NPDC047315]|uniref:ATP-binding protein n=1 Tax=Streptomyces sp. NPDC047315 TaxID=3155142 RepID=UPI0033C5650C